MAMTFIKVTIGIMLLCSTYAIRLHGPQSNTTKDGSSEGSNEMRPHEEEDPSLKRPQLETSKADRPGDEPPSKTSDAGPGGDSHRRPPPSLVEPPEELPPAETSKPGPGEELPSKTSDAGPGGDLHRRPPPSLVGPPEELPPADTSKPGPEKDPSSETSEAGPGGVPENIHCFRTKVTCGSNCTQNGGRCNRNGTACCKRNDLNRIPSSDQDTPQQNRPSSDNTNPGEDGVPENIHCFRTKVTCGSNCTQIGGRCNRNGTACCKRKDLNRIPSSDEDTPQQNIQEERRCLPTKGTCGSNCTQNGGRCVRNGTVCCHKKDEDDKNNLVRDGGAAETGAENIADNANATIVDEGYLFYNGMTLRCTKAKCTKKCTESRGGFCMKGKCCYKKTENEAQSRCAKEKQHVLKGRPIVAGQNTHDEHLHCTVGGSYLARCQGQECHCLNASSGERIGKPKKVTSLDQINCDKEQNKTKPKRIRIKVKLSDNPLSAYGQPEKDAMKSALRDNLEKKYPVDADIELYDGSVMANVNLGLCADDCAATAQTTDLFSISRAVVSEINEGSIHFEVNGETIIPSGAAIKDIHTAEMLQNLEKEMTKTLEESEKEMMVTIITVTAVVVVVMFVLGLAVACYCSSTKKTKYVIEEKGGIYDDFKGKDNPSYIYHLEGGR